MPLLIYFTGALRIIARILFQVMGCKFGFDSDNMKFQLLVLITGLGFFIISCNQNRKPAKVSEVTLIKVADDPHTRAFISFWKEFSIKYRLSDTASMKKFSMDSVWIWNKEVARSNFDKYFSHKYFDSGLQKIILDTNKTRYSWIGCYGPGIIKDAVKKYNERTGQYEDYYNCQQAIIEDTIGSIVNAYEFTFLESKKGYKLSGFSSYSYSWSSTNKMVDTTSASEN